MLVASLSVGVAIDVLSFDRTRGGYEPPYTGYTGEPIDWETGYVSDEGFFKDGYVVDIHADCTNGMIGFEIFQQRWDWRKFSERALVVHEPAAACELEGFEPEF